MKKPVLRITTEPDIWGRLHGIAQTAEAGGQTGHTLNFASVALLLEMLTPGSLRLAQQLIGQQPLSIRAIAQQVGRDRRRVHDDVHRLHKLGLLAQDGQGRWACPYSAVHFDMLMQAA